MKLEKLKQELCKYGHLQIIKEGYVFTVLITKMASSLSNYKNVAEIQKAIINYTSEKYPIIELLVNDDNFFLVVLHPSVPYKESLKEAKKRLDFIG